MECINRLEIYEENDKWNGRNPKYKKTNDYLLVTNVEYDIYIKIVLPDNRHLIIESNELLTAINNCKKSSMHFPYK